MENKEIFKDIPNYEGFYMCSNMGRVYSKRNGIYLKPCKTKSNNIWNVKLSVFGDLKTFSCAKLVALTFIENPNPKLYKYAIHKNGNLNDYSLPNIMWGTSLHSVSRKWNRHPELKDKFKQHSETFKSPTQKMTPELINSLIKYREIGYSSRQLQDIFPIKKSQIMNIIRKYYSS